MTPTHTQKLECSLTGYPLSVCVWVWVGVPTTIGRCRGVRGSNLCQTKTLVNTHTNLVTIGPPGDQK